MAKFKKGDRVRCIVKVAPLDADLGTEGTIVDEDDSGMFEYDVRWDTGLEIGVDGHEIELASKPKRASTKKTTKRITKLAPKKKKPMASSFGSVGIFNSGDKVVLMSGRYSDGPSNPRWGGAYGSLVGTVLMSGGSSLVVDWGNGSTNTYDMRDLTPYSQVAGAVRSTTKPKEFDLSQLDSIVIDEKIKGEIISVLKQHKNSKKLFEEWGLGEVIEYGKGMTFMFYGPPGTGKTGMARCIAKAVGTELLVISAAEIQSSEPGAANRNIQNAFADAKENGKVLFLDECDSLITSRNDLGMVLAGEVNTLLTEIEKYEGVLVLATNRIEHMDEALERRISLIVEFAPPNFEARKEIWKKLLPKKMPLASDVNTDALAEREITGGQIKNVVLAAARLALANEDKEVTLQHFTSAIERVCASKNLMGAASRYRQGVMNDVHAHVTRGRSTGVDVGVDKKRTVDAFLDEQLKEEGV